MKRFEKIFEEIVPENFPNLGKETYIQVKESQRVPNEMNPKRKKLKRIIIKWLKLRIKREF